MAWPLAWVIIVGTLPGVFLGAIIRIKYLPDPKNFKLFVGCVLLYIGIRLLLDLTKKAAEKKVRTRMLEERFKERSNTGEKKGCNQVRDKMRPSRPSAFPLPGIPISSTVRYFPLTQ